MRHYDDVGIYFIVGVGTERYRSSLPAYVVRSPRSAQKQGHVAKDDNKNIHLVTSTRYQNAKVTHQTTVRYLFVTQSSAIIFFCCQGRQDKVCEIFRQYGVQLLPKAITHTKSAKKNKNKNFFEVDDVAVLVTWRKCAVDQQHATLYTHPALKIQIATYPTKIIRMTTLTMFKAHLLKCASKILDIFIT